MNELDLLRKKTGMTIAKAWMLMATTIVILVLSIGIFNYFISVNKTLTPTLEDSIFYLTSYIFVFFLGSLSGFFVNKKQLPFFRKTTFLIYIWGFMIAIVWCYINPIILDLLPLNPVSFKDNKIFLLLNMIVILFYIVLQIGIIGHGLLKNYTFRNALFTVIAVSITLIDPQSVLILIFYSSILYYIYYRTASFQLVIFIVTISATVETLLPVYFDANFTGNYVRNYFIQNNTLYYAGFVACVGLIIGGSYYIKTHTQLIEWQRPEEDENIEFL